MSGDESELGDVFKDMARLIAEDVAPVVDVQGCSGRLMERVEAAVTQGRHDRRSPVPAAVLRRWWSGGGAQTTAQRVSMVSTVPLGASTGTALPS